MPDITLMLEAVSQLNKKTASWTIIQGRSYW
jgi:hypothetical protein